VDAWIQRKLGKTVPTDIRRTQHFHDSSGWRGLLTRRSLLMGTVAGALASIGAPNLAAADVDMASYQPLNTFAHIAYGTEQSGFYWKTIFVLNNINNSAATVHFLFYTTGGAPLAVPLVGSAPASQPVFNIPAYGSVVVELDETAGPVSAGWVGVIIDGNVSVQGIFRKHTPGQADVEALVPMFSRSQPACIIPFPPGTVPAVLAMPFDNTNNYVTSVAFANTATSSRTLDLEFIDENGLSLWTAHEDLEAHNQVAFDTAGRYPAVAGKKGFIRVLNTPLDFTALGFRFNPENAFSTWLPVIR
jgi:hypothetical protein